MMEEFGADYRQILTLSMPALESVAGPDETPAIACGLDFFGAEQAGGVRVGLPLRPRRRPENQVVTKL